MQITTFSRLLTDGGKRAICDKIGRDVDAVQILTLQQINTEEQFLKRIGHFLDHCKHTDDLQTLIVQSTINPETPHSLVECVRYAILNQVQQHKEVKSPFCIILVLQVPRIYGGFFSGFPGLQWKALHIDELCGDPHGMNFSNWSHQTLHQVLQNNDDLDLQKVVAEAIPKAVSAAFNHDSRASARVVDCVEILTNCLAGDEQVWFVKQLSHKGLL